MVFHNERSHPHTVYQNEELPRGSFYFPREQSTRNVQVSYHRSFGWEQPDHRPYCPNLAPTDCQLFLHLKIHLSSGGKTTMMEIVKTVSPLLMSFWRQPSTYFDKWKNQAAVFFYDGMQKLAVWCNMCVCGVSNPKVSWILNNSESR